MHSARYATIKQKFIISRLALGAGADMLPHRLTRGLSSISGARIALDVAAILETLSNGATGFSCLIHMFDADGSPRESEGIMISIAQPATPADAIVRTKHLWSQVPGIILYRQMTSTDKWIMKEHTARRRVSSSPFVRFWAF
jgi:hypothetical protein